MSMVALLQAVRDRLRAAVLSGGLAYENGQCECGWDGQPPPASGQVYAAVWPGDISSGSDQCMDEYYSCTVTLSMRLGQLPVDRWGVQNVAKATSGLYAKAEAIRALLHMNETVRSAANTIIGAQDNGFVETIRYLGMSPPREQGPDWWWADAEAPGAPVGLSIDVRLGQARRIQVIEEQS